VNKVEANVGLSAIHTSWSVGSVNHFYGQTVRKAKPALIYFHCVY